jgi:hypothetical protein
MFKTIKSMVTCWFETEMLTYTYDVYNKKNGDYMSKEVWPFLSPIRSVYAGLLLRIWYFIHRNDK